MIKTRQSLYYGWILLAAVVFVVLAGSGIRAVFGVFIKPIEAEFGWTRQQLSGAAALSLFVLGAVGPAVGWLADIWGPRRVMLLAATTLSPGIVPDAAGTGICRGGTDGEQQLVLSRWPEH